MAHQRLYLSQISQGYYAAALSPSKCLRVILQGVHDSDFLLIVYDAQFPMSPSPISTQGGERRGYMQKGKDNFEEYVVGVEGGYRKEVDNQEEQEGEEGGGG